MATKMISLVEVTLCVLKALDQVEKIKDIQSITLDRPITGEPFQGMAFAHALEDAFEAIGVELVLDDVIKPGISQNIETVIETVFKQLEEQT